MDNSRASYRSEAMEIRHRDKRIGREQAAIDSLLQPGDATSYRQPRIYSGEERERMATYESVDAFEPHSSIYLDHLQFRYNEPRWFIWVFTLVVGFLSGLSAVAFVACMHVLMNMKYYLLDYAIKGFPTQTDEQHRSIASDIFSGVQLPMQGSSDRNVVLGYVMWASFSVLCSLIAAVLLKLVPEARGVGSPDVLAYLNGVDNINMTEKRVFLARIVISLLTIASGACTGYFGTLIQSGVMISTFVTERSRLIQFPNINVIRCFRNPKDRRNLAIIGAAAGVGSAFSITIGGLMYVVEQVAQVIPVRVALYTFCSCLVSSFTMQVYFSYINSFSPRDREGTDSGALLKDALIIFDTKLIRTNIVSMNIFDIIPTVFIGIICGGLSVLYVRLSWVSLRLRRRLQATLFHDFKFIEPVLITFIYVTMTYWIAVAWGPTIAPTDTPSTGCSYVPDAFTAKREQSVIGFYGMVSSLCDLGPESSSNSSSIDPFQPGPVEGRLPVVHNFASLAMAPADSALQFLLTWSTADYLQLPTLAVFFFIYFIFTSMTAGIAMSGDVILPALVIGGTVGRMCGQVAREAAKAIDPETLTWADPALFALIGAGSFLGGVSGMTFSVCIILMEMTGDNRHIICIMIAISISKSIADRFCHPITVSHLEAKCVPVLDFATRIHKYDMFCARNVMQGPVLTFTSTMDAKTIVEALGTTHNGFPVVSVRDRTFKGMILRWQLEIMLWNLYWTRKADPCTYARIREIEDRRFGEKLSGLPPLSKKLLRVHIDLMPYVDQSAYAIHEATSLSRTYHMFRTLGLRHLVVINRSNQVVGMITRKDLVSDRMMERIQEENEKRRQNMGLAYGSLDGGTQRDHDASPENNAQCDRASMTGSDAAIGSGGDLTQDALSTFLLRQRKPVAPENVYAVNGSDSGRSKGFLGFLREASEAPNARKMPKLSDLVIDEYEDQEYTVIDVRESLAPGGSPTSQQAPSLRQSTHNPMPTAGSSASVDALNRQSIADFSRREGYLTKSLITDADADVLDNLLTLANQRKLDTEARRSEALVTSPMGIAASYASPPAGGLGQGLYRREGTAADDNTSGVAGSDQYLAPKVTPYRPTQPQFQNMLSPTTGGGAAAATGTRVAPPAARSLTESVADDSTQNGDATIDEVIEEDDEAGNYDSTAVMAAAQKPSPRQPTPPVADGEVAAVPPSVSSKEPSPEPIVPKKE